MPKQFLVLSIILHTSNGVFNFLIYAIPYITDQYTKQRKDKIRLKRNQQQQDCNFKNDPPQQEPQLLLVGVEEEQQQKQREQRHQGLLHNRYESISLATDSLLALLFSTNTSSNAISPNRDGEDCDGDDHNRNHSDGGINSDADDKHVTNNPRAKNEERKDNSNRGCGGDIVDSNVKEENNNNSSSNDATTIPMSYSSSVALSSSVITMWAMK